MAQSKEGLFAKFYRVVAQIPQGRVATYGQVALRAGLPRHARFVGFALHALRSGTDLPWHRVVNAQGRSSLGRIEGEEDLQRGLLEAEGVVFGPSGAIDLKRFGWGAEPPGSGATGRKGRVPRCRS